MSSMKVTLISERSKQIASRTLALLLSALSMKVRVAEFSRGVFFPLFFSRRISFVSSKSLPSLFGARALGALSLCFTEKCPLSPEQTEDHLSSCRIPSANPDAAAAAGEEAGRKTKTRRMPLSHCSAPAAPRRRLVRARLASPSSATRGRGSLSLSKRCGSSWRPR